MTDETENSDNMQLEGKPWQFQKGKSGNPAGKPKGTRNQVTVAIQALLEGEAEAITRKAIDLALAGDMTAIKLVLERIFPVPRDAHIIAHIPPIGNAADTLQAVTAIINDVAGGKLRPSEGQQLTAMIENLRKSYELAEIESRLKLLEEKND